MDTNNETFSAPDERRFATPASAALRGSEIAPSQVALTLRPTAELGAQWLSSRQPQERFIEITHFYADSECRWARVGISIRTGS